jgi:RNA polymerase sigma factor (sigma-70 family)
MNKSEYEEAFRSLQAQVQRIVASKVFAPEAVIEDACAFAWMQAWRYARTLDAEPRVLRAWLVLVATREAWLRNSELEAGAADISEIEVAAPARDEVAASETRRRALDMIGSLPPQQARVVSLWAVGYSYEEITEILGISYTAVNKALTKAKARLRKRSE